MSTKSFTVSTFSGVLVSLGRPDGVLFCEVKVPSLISLDHVWSVERPGEESGKALVSSDLIYGTVLPNFDRIIKYT